MRALESKQMLKMSTCGTNTRIQRDEQHREQELSAANREVRLARSKRLMKKYCDSDVDFTYVCGFRTRK